MFGVEPICTVLPIALSTYHRHRHQRTSPTRRSAWAQRDDQLHVEIQRVYDEHQQVYGPRKVWKQLRRDCIRVARLMRAMGLAGATRALQGAIRVDYEQLQGHVDEAVRTSVERGLTPT